MSDEEIHAHWAQVRADAQKGALEARKTNLLSEVAAIEAELKAFVEKEVPVVKGAIAEAEKVVKEVIDAVEGKSSASPKSTEEGSADEAETPKKNGKPASA